MRKVLLLITVLMATLAAAQTKTGASIGFNNGPKDANGCQIPNANELLACIYSTGEIKISAYGSPYADPTNMLTSGIPGPQGPAGPAGPAGATGATGPAGAPAPRWTQLNCQSITGTMTLGNGGVVTITNAVGVNCTQQ